MNDSTLSIGTDVHLEEIVRRAADHGDGHQVIQPFSVTNSLPGAHSPLLPLWLRAGLPLNPDWPGVRLPSYKPRAMLAITSSAHPTATSQKPISEVITGIDVRFARIPTTPRIKATIQVICFGALVFKFICSLLSDMSEDSLLDGLPGAIARKPVARQPLSTVSAAASTRQPSS